MRKTLSLLLFLGFLSLCTANALVKTNQIIDTIYPGSIAQGQTNVQFTINGRTLETGCQVNIIPSDGLTIGAIGVHAPDYIFFYLSAGAFAPTGPRTVEVVNPDGTSYEAPGLITVIAPVTNPVVRINPNIGEISTTVTATLEGGPFDTAASLEFGSGYTRFGYITINTYEVVNAAKIQLNFTINASAPASAVGCVVRNPDGGTGQDNFFIINRVPSFEIDRIYYPGPDLTRFPVNSSWSPFILEGIGFQTGATVSISDPSNITFIPLVNVTSDGDRLTIFNLTIAAATPPGTKTIYVHNPDGNTATFNIEVYDPLTAPPPAGEITNLNPVYTTGGSYFNVQKDEFGTFGFVVWQEIADLELFLVSGRGMAQRFVVGDVKPGTFATVQGAGSVAACQVRVSSTGTGKIRVKLADCLNNHLSDGINSLILFDRATGKRFKANFITHSFQ